MKYSNLIKKHLKDKIIINFPLGSGKSKSTIELAKHCRFQRPHLIVVNTTKEVDRFKEELPKYDWYYQTDEAKENILIRQIRVAVKELIGINPETYEGLEEKLGLELKESVVQNIKAFQFKNEDKKGFIITKKKFNELLKQEEGYELLNKFNSISIDEINELEFITKHSFENESDTLIKKELLNIDEEKLDFKNSFMKEIDIKTNKIENPKRFIEKLLNMNDKLFVFKERYEESHIYMKNSILFQFLKEFKGSIMILDATAEQSKYIYDELRSFGFKYIDETRNKKYPNLEIVYNRLYSPKDEKKLIMMSMLRAYSQDNKEIRDKKIKIIRKFTINENLIFTNKDTANLIKNLNEFKDKEVNYIYSGEDIGSNRFREHSEMCILYGQTINRNMVEINAKIFKANPKEIRNKMISQRIIQLIGRTKIREDDEHPVKVRIIEYPELDLDEVKNYYGCKVIEEKIPIKSNDFLKDKPLLDILIDNIKRGNPKEIKVMDYVKSTTAHYKKGENENTRKDLSKKLRKLLPDMGYRQSEKSMRIFVKR